MRKRTVRRRNCTNLSMGNGRGKANTIIDGDEVKHYVGIGWIILRKATKSDRKRYPRLVD